MMPEPLAWLCQRHPVAVRPELAADPGALRRALYNTRALLLPRKVVVTREMLDFAPVLRAVARLHGGSDNTDLEACREHGVRVIETSAAGVRANVEFLLASLLMLLRGGMALSLAGQRHAEAALGRELNGSLVGLVGLGPVAQVLAPMLRSLGARLVGYDPALHPQAAVWEGLKVRPVSLPQLLAQADAVSVLVKFAPHYQGFFNDAVLAHCRPGQLWVGLSRSSLFEAAALARALADGRIKACVLDGAEAGFASRGSALHEAQNLHLTPRLGAYTQPAQARAGWLVARGLHEALTLPEAALAQGQDSGLTPAGGAPA